MSSFFVKQDVWKSPWGLRVPSTPVFLQSGAGELEVDVVGEGEARGEAGEEARPQAGSRIGVRAMTAARPWEWRRS